MKRRIAFVVAISLLGLSGFPEVSMADVFQADNISGTIALNHPVKDPETDSLIFSLNYVGTIRFDESAVDTLSPSLQDYKSFIANGGSLSLTIFTPFGNFPFSSTSIAPGGNSEPTLLVQNNEPVAFDFRLLNEGTSPTDLSFSARIPNPVKPGLGTTSYTGIQGNVTLTGYFFNDTHESFAGKTVPTFAVVPEPSTILLIGLGASIFGLRARRQRGWV